MNLYNPNFWWAQVTLSVDLSFNYYISQELVTKFQERVKSKSWGLKKDGDVAEINLSHKYYPKIEIAFEMDDEKTIEAFRRIPQWIKRQIPREDFPLRLKVFVYPDEEDKDLFYWNEYNDEDVLILTQEGSWYLESVKNCFSIVTSLNKEVTSIFNKLPDIEPYFR